MTAAPRGLPEKLPPGERLLWQGGPDWRVLARRAFHVPKLIAYFAAIIACVAALDVSHNETPVQIALDVGRGVLAAAIPIALILLYSWAVSRSSVYTVTDRRLVLRIGLALPVTINLPFTSVASAGLQCRADGSGDIAVATQGTARLAYLVLWPHARPWHFSRAEPMLRSVRDAGAVAQLLARALAASADMPAPVLSGGARAGAPADATVTA